MSIFDKTHASRDIFLSKAACTRLDYNRNTVLYFYVHGLGPQRALPEYVLCLVTSSMISIPNRGRRIRVFIFVLVINVGDKIMKKLNYLWKEDFNWKNEENQIFFCCYFLSNDGVFSWINGTLNFLFIKILKLGS